VFIYSEKGLRLLARFREVRFVAGHKRTVEARAPDGAQRVCQTRRAHTIDPPTKEQFDEF
jgi:hypothetical protein